MDELKRKAGEQSVLLAEKQAEADTALREITISMQVHTVFSLTHLNNTVCTNKWKQFFNQNISDNILFSIFLIALYCQTFMT